MHIIATSHTSRNFLLPELSSVTVDVLGIYISLSGCHHRRPSPTSICDITFQPAQVKPCEPFVNCLQAQKCVTFSSTYVFSGAGGPITNFGHQLLLPTQFSFGPGTPG